MIDDELRPAVTGFVAEMLNDPRCKSVLLDVGEDAQGGQWPACPLLGRHWETIRVHFLHSGGRVFGEHSKLWRGRNNNNSEGKRGSVGALGVARLNQDETMGGQMVKLFDWEFLKHVTEVCENYVCKGGNDSLGLEVSAWNDSIHIVVASVGHRFVFEADTVRGYKATVFEHLNNYWGTMFDVGYTFDGDEIFDAFNSFLVDVEVENN